MSTQTGRWVEGREGGREGGRKERREEGGREGGRKEERVHGCFSPLFPSVPCLGRQSRNLLKVLCVLHHEGASRVGTIMKVRHE